jgi:hypothetical protein
MKKAGDEPAQGMEEKSPISASNTPRRPIPPIFAPRC